MHSKHSQPMFSEEGTLWEHEHEDEIEDDHHYSDDFNFQTPHPNQPTTSLVEPPPSKLAQHIIKGPERYRPQPPSKSGNIAYVIFSGDNRGVYYNWSAADKALDLCYKRSLKGFLTYDAAHAAWDVFVSQGCVPDGCSNPNARDNGSPHINFPRPSQSPASPYRSMPTTPSRQRSLPDSVPSPFDSHLLASPSQGSTRPFTSAQPVSQKLPTPGQWSVGPQSESAKSPTFKDEDDKNNWWVVFTGAEPGVYYGKAAGERAMGFLANPTFICTDSQSAADRLFVEAYSKRQIARLV